MLVLSRNATYKSKVFAAITGSQRHFMNTVKKKSKLSLRLLYKMALAHINGNFFYQHFAKRGLEIQKDGFFQTPVVYDSSHKHSE